MSPITFAIALLLSPVAQSNQIPAGTVIPVILNSSLNTAKDKAEKRVEAKVMQDGSLPSGLKIRRGARSVGHTVDVSKGSLRGKQRASSATNLYSP